MGMCGWTMQKMAAQPICYLSVAVLKTYDRKDF